MLEVVCGLIATYVFFGVALAITLRCHCNKWTLNIVLFGLLHWIPFTVRVFTMKRDGFAMFHAEHFEWVTDGQGFDQEEGK